MAGSALGTGQIMAPNATAPAGGKGGGYTAQPMQQAAQPIQQVAPPASMLNQGGQFNVNQAASGALQGALQGTSAGLNYQPLQVQGTNYQASLAGPAGQVANANLSAYTNPYESQVVDATLADLERSRLMQQNQLGSQATAARAFGGSRQGIAEAETNRGFAQQAANAAAGLRQAGYQNAQQLAGQDIGRQMQVDTQNQAALNAQRAFGATQGMTAQQLNQGAGLQGAQFRLSAANQLGGLGQQAFDTGRTIRNDQLIQGAMQQAQQQQLIDAAKAQYAGFAGAPNASLAAPLAALGATPNQSTTTQSQQPGLFNYLSLLA